MKFRNSIDVISQQNILIDAESLWELVDDLLVLVDEDQYISHPFDRSIFYPVED